MNEQHVTGQVEGNNIVAGDQHIYACRGCEAAVLKAARWLAAVLMVGLGGLGCAWWLVGQGVDGLLAMAPLAAGGFAVIRGMQD